MKQVIFSILTAFLLASCVGDFLNDLDKVAQPELKPTVAAPLLHGEFSLEDYLDVVADSVTITQDADSVVVIEYSGDPVTSDRAETLINVPNQSFQKSVSLTLAEINGLPGGLTLSKSFSFDETIVAEPGASDALDSMYMKAGTMQLSISGTMPVSGSIDITFNSIFIGGQILTRTITWTYDPLNPGQSYNENIDLAGAFGDFTKGGTTANTFNYNVDATIIYEGVSMNPTDEIVINTQVLGPKFRLVYGKFSQRGFLTDPGSVNIGVLDNVNADAFYLDSPEIEFKFQNSFGIPVEAQVIQLDAIDKNNQVLAFTGTVIDSPTVIANPSVSAVGSYAQTNLSINNANSNIVDIIAFLPSQLDYQFQGTVIPDTLNQQFVMDTSEVLGEYTVRLPLSGRVSNFTSDKVFDLTNNSLDSVEFSLENTKITIHSINGLPITVDMTLECYDANSNLILTLFQNDNILDPAEIDNNGLVITPTEKTVEQVLSEADFEALKQVKSFTLVSTLYTGKTGMESVKIRMKDKVEVSLFVETTVKF